MRGVTPALWRRLEVSDLIAVSAELVTEDPCIMGHLEDKDMIRSDDGGRSSRVRCQAGTRARWSGEMMGH